MDRTRWLFAGQLGPQFDDGGKILLIEARSVFGRVPMHRAKAHIILSAIRHRARTGGKRLEFHQVEDYREVVTDRDDLEVIDPTSFRARRAVRAYGAHVLPSRGFVTSEADFADWVGPKEGKRLLMEDFYRWVRAREDILMEGKSPVGGSWNYDAKNRNPPPKGATNLGLPAPWWPTEDEIDEEVRADLDRWQKDGLVTLVGDDGPRRFAVTPEEAEAALDDFIDVRLPDFGTYEDATLTNDWTMAHSLLSVPMNMGVIDPRRIVDRAVAAYEAGDAPIEAVEGFVRQIVGWRDWMWHLYWHLGEKYQTSHNALDAKRPVPREFHELDTSGVEANCLKQTLGDLRRHGWNHHIQRLMILGNWGLQRGFDPSEFSDWFVSSYVDGTPWVMPANVVGMSQHADGGIVATKPYAAGGAYVNKMTDYCKPCRFDPKVRVGENACPVTAGYWAFLDRAEPHLRGNHRMNQPLAGLRRLSDREEVVEQERDRVIV